MSPPPVPLGELLAFLRDRGYPIGVDDHVRVGRLVARSSIWRLDELKVALRSVLARDPGSSAELDEAFAIFFSGRPGVAPPVEDPDAGSRVLAGIGIAAVVIAIVAATILGWRRLGPIAVDGPIAGVSPSGDGPAATAAGSGDGAAGTPVAGDGGDRPGDGGDRPPDGGERPTPPPRPPVPEGPRAFVGPIIRDVPRRPELVEPTPPPPPIDWQGALAIALLVTGLGGLIGALGIRRRVRLRRAAFAPGPFLYRRPRPRRSETFFDRATIEDGAAFLTWQASEATSTEIDVDRTVARTVAAGGFPSVELAPPPSAPEYAILEDVAAGATPWRPIYDELFERLRAQGVRLSRYTFEDVPSVVVSTETGRTIALEDIDEYHDALLIVGDGDGGWDPFEERTADWVRTLQGFPRRLWLHPRPPTRWSHGARAIARTTPMEHGTVAALSALQVDADRPPPPDPAYPATIHLAPASDVAVNALRAHLGEDGYRLLRLVAVAGDPDAEIALWLAERCAIELADTDRLRLVSLELFAEGRWPDGLQKRLAAEAHRDEPALEDQTQRAVLELVEGSEPPTGSAAHLRWRLERATLKGARNDERAFADLQRLVASPLHHEATLALDGLGASNWVGGAAAGLARGGAVAIVLGAAILLGAPAWIAERLEPFGRPVDPHGREALVGSAACARCHGLEQPVPGPPSLQEHRAWNEGGEGSHRRAWASLRSDAGRELTSLLAKLEGRVDATTRCQPCHGVPLAAEGWFAMPVPGEAAAIIAPDFQGLRAPEEKRLAAIRDEGVGCEACHGLAAEWISAHADRGWTAQQTPELLHRKFGMRSLRDPGTWVDACARCHLAVDTNLLAAGHPGLDAFEVVSASEQISHWRDFEAETPHFGARLWMAGQAAAFRAAAGWLIDELETGKPRRAEKPRVELLRRWTLFRRIATMIDPAARDRLDAILAKPILMTAEEGFEAFRIVERFVEEVPWIPLRRQDVELLLLAIAQDETARGRAPRETLQALDSLWSSLWSTTAPAPDLEITGAVSFETDARRFKGRYWARVVLTAQYEDPGGEWREARGSLETEQGAVALYDADAPRERRLKGLQEFRGLIVVPRPGSGRLARLPPRHDEGDPKGIRTRRAVRVRFEAELVTRFSDDTELRTGTSDPTVRKLDPAEIMTLEWDPVIVEFPPPDAGRVGGRAKLTTELRFVDTVQAMERVARSLAAIPPEALPTPEAIEAISREIESVVRRRREPTEDDEPAFVGSRACAGSDCHGRPQPRAARPPLDEHLRWTAIDPETGRARNRHFAAARRLIDDPRSAKIMTGINEPAGTNEAAYESGRCLSCHSTSANDHRPAALESGLQADGFDLHEGVGCEACHGPASEWLGSHVSKSLEPGRGDRLDDVNVWASRCGRCHASVPVDLVDAGHSVAPMFELVELSARNSHWRAPGEREGTFELALWIAGQVTATKLIASEIARSLSRARDIDPIRARIDHDVRRLDAHVSLLGALTYAGASDLTEQVRELREALPSQSLADLSLLADRVAEVAEKLRDPAGSPPADEDEEALQALIGGLARAATASTSRELAELLARSVIVFAAALGDEATEAAARRLVERTTTESHRFDADSFARDVRPIESRYGAAFEVLLRARIDGNEAAAIASLRTLQTAQTLFREADTEKDGEHDFGTLQELTEVGFIDSVLGSGRKSGYRFAVLLMKDSEFEWSATAAPIHLGVTGTRSFFIDETGVIRWSADGPAGSDDPPVERK